MQMVQVVTGETGIRIAVPLLSGEEVREQKNQLQTQKAARETWILVIYERTDEEAVHQHQQGNECDWARPKSLLICCVW